MNSNEKKFEKMFKPKDRMMIRIEYLFMPKWDAINKNIDYLNPLSNANYEKFLQTIKNIPNVKTVKSLTIEFKLNIMKNLLLMYTSNETEFVYVIEEVKCIMRNDVNPTETVPINLKDLPKLTNLITEIEKGLGKLTRNNLKCGIRRNIVFIHLPNLNWNKKECLMIISNILSGVMHTIPKHMNQHLSDSDLSKQFIKEEYAEKKSFLSFESSFSTTKKNPDDSANNSFNKKFFSMITFNKALDILREVAYADENRLKFDTVKIQDAYDRILHEDVSPKWNMPPFRTSNIHGYAVVAKFGKGIKKIQNEKTEIPPILLDLATCAWVNSGDPIPTAATAVVPEEDTIPLDEILDYHKYIDIRKSPKHGQNIKPINYDLRSDKNIIKKFTRIGPEEMGLLAACGYDKVKVAKQLSIGVLSIGDNLNNPGETLKTWSTYDCNRISLISLLKRNGYSSLDFGIVSNKKSSIREKILNALRVVDLLVTTGSNNDKDLLKSILTKSVKAEIHFGNICLKPGKSTTLASCKINNKTKYLLCLSRNPTSAFVTANLFLIPFVNSLHGKEFINPATIIVQVNTPFVLYNYPRLVWAQLKWSYERRVIEVFSMSNLYKDRYCNIIGSNALLILPEKKASKDQSINLLKNTPIHALLIDFPEKFDSLLPVIMTNKSTFPHNY